MPFAAGQAEVETPALRLVADRAMLALGVPAVCARADLGTIVC